MVEGRAVEEPVPVGQICLRGGDKAPVMPLACAAAVVCP